MLSWGAQAMFQDSVIHLKYLVAVDCAAEAEFGIHMINKECLIKISYHIKNR